MASRSDVIAGGAAVEIRALDYTAQVFGKVEANLHKLGSSAMKIGGAMVASAAAAAAGLTAFTVATASSAAAVDDASKRTGVGVEALQELRYGAEQTGGSFDDVANGFKFLAKAMENDTGRKKLEELGLSLAELDRMSPEDRFAAVAEAIKNMGDASAQSNAAQEIFGRGFSGLLPMLQEGAAGINRYRSEARSLGQVVSAEGVSALASLDDAVAKVTGSIRGFAGTLASQLAPYIEPVANAITNIVATLGEWLAANSGFTAGLVGTIGAVGVVGTVIAGFGAALVAAGSVISAATAIFGFLSAAVATVSAPLLIVAGVVTALVVGFLALGAAVAFLVLPFVDLNAIAGAFGATLEWLQGVASSVAESIWSAFGPMLQGMMDAFSNGDLAGAAEIAFIGIQIAATNVWAGLLDSTQMMLAALTAGFAGLVPGIDEAFAAFEELNSAAKKGFQIDMQMAVSKQATTKATNEAAKAAADLAKAEEAASAEYDALVADAWQASMAAQNAAPVAKAVEAVTDSTAAQDRFEASGGTNFSGAAAFLGGVTMFQPLQDEAKKQTEHLQAIRNNTRDGLGAQIA